MKVSNARGAAGSLGRVLVLGLGKSGKSVVRYCAGLLGERVEGIFVAAGAETDDSKAFLEPFADAGVSWAFGDDALRAERGHFDVCIASPGIPFWHELYRTAQSCADEVISEIEFAWRESSPESTWVAITGTNGKTTTTSLAAHVLRACGFAASAVGNIGDVCLDAVAAGDTDVYVAEVSSYQLYSTRDFAPDVAVVLNITPDHVHWHRTFEAYALAKFNVLRGFDEPSRANGPVAHTGHSVAILDATNDVVRAKVRELKTLGADYIPIGTAAGIAGASGDMRARCGAENAAFITDRGALVVAYAGREHDLGPTADLQIKGAHNASNALAAGAVAIALGADEELVRAALASFPPLEHRIEPCGDIGGVICYNDSKATNIDATVKALEAFEDASVIVLLGGDDKGTDLDELIDCVYAHAQGAVCFGAAGPRFSAALDQALEADRAPQEAQAAQADRAPQAAQAAQAAQVAQAARPANSLKRADAGNLESALDAALALACPGDVVLLSPACASFDEFSSFEERGRIFKELVAARAARARGAVPAHDNAQARDDGSALGEGL